MQDNPEIDELDSADDVHRQCKKFFYFIFCIGKRARKGCDHGSEVWTCSAKNSLCKK